MDSGEILNYVIANGNGDTEKVKTLINITGAPQLASSIKTIVKHYSADELYNLALECGQNIDKLYCTLLSTNPTLFEEDALEITNHSRRSA